MKTRTLSCWFASVVCIIAALMGYTLPALASDGLVGYWPFDGNAQDYSIYTNHGIVHGALSYVGHPGFGQAGNFDLRGSNYIEVLHQSQYVFTSSFTIAFWGKNLTGGPVPPTHPGRIIQKHYPAGAASEEWDIVLQSDSIHFMHAWPTINGEELCTISNAPSEWTHYAYRYDHSVSTMTALINGSVATSAVPVRPMVPLDTTRNITLMYDRETAGYSATGLLDEVRLYNRALTDGEVTELARFETGTNWVCVTSAAPWIGRQHARCEAFNGSLWVMGGQYGEVLSIVNDVWSSPDGTNWNQVTAAAPWAARHSHASAVFQGKLWIMGGTLTHYPYAVTNDIWYTADGTNWLCATNGAAWPARKSQHLVEMNGKLWLLNGYKNENPFDDVWSSVDGSNWMQETSAAPWGQRCFPAVAAFEGCLYVMGGFTPDITYLNDVWRSPDGTNWTLVTSNAAWTARALHSSMVFDQKLWIMGGTFPSGILSNDVWWTVDGSNWMSATPAAEWPMRTAFADTVFANRMWVLGGGGQSGISYNDVWCTPPPAPEPMVITNPPAAPSTVAASDGTYTNKVALTWNASSGATKYAVWRNTIDESSSATVVSPELTTNVYDDYAVTPGATYFYWVKAGNAAGWSGFSAGDSGYAGSATAVPVVSPTFLDFSTNSSLKFAYCGNNGGASYTFDAAVTSGGSWLGVAPSQGTVVVQSVALVLSAGRASLSPGVYTGQVTVTPSVGALIVVTARVEVTAGNVVLAEANGPYEADQGTPAAFTAVGSQGNMLLYRWEVGLDFISGFSSNYFAYLYTNTYDAGVYDVLLTVRDTNSPPNIASDSTLLTVRNVAPSVDLGGPYQAGRGTNVLFTAVISDPGIHDTHECRFDFEGDGTWDTPWTNSATSVHAYALGGTYVALCEARDQHGAVGSDSATVMIEADNVPPVATAVVWGTTLTETNLPGLGYVVMMDGSGAYDPDHSPNPALYFDWREDVENPQKPVLYETNKHAAVIATKPLDKSGVYRFHLVVFDGQYLSAPATVTVRVPGWEGSVICEGFVGRVPLWGVEVIVTNTYSHELKTGRTDTEGYFLADSGRGYQIALLSRRDRTKNEAITIDADGEFTENIYFPPSYYIYAGQVVTGSPGSYVGLPDAQTELLIGNGMSAQCDAMGSFGYGMVPETWPLDGKEYWLRIQKAGSRSAVRKIRLNMNRNGEVISLGTIQGVAQVSGTVRALMSGLLVSGVMVDFGSGWTATSGTNGAFGPVNVPNGDYMVRMTKGGFSNTLAYVTNLVAGATNVALQIEGGEKSVYGQIYNMQGRPVTNATVEVVEEGGKKGAGKGEVMTASGTGYYATWAWRRASGPTAYRRQTTTAWRWNWMWSRTRRRTSCWCPSRRRERPGCCAFVR